jgi:hypothetical protein
MADDVEKRSAKQWRKQARPKRAYRVDVRFGEDEIKRLDERCAERHQSRSAFIRSAAMNDVRGGKNIVVTHNADVARLVIEANKIGVNVNQIARAFNRAKSDGRLMSSVAITYEDQLKKAAVLMDTLRQEIAGLRNDLEHDMVRREWDVLCREADLLGMTPAELKEAMSDVND